MEVSVSASGHPMRWLQTERWVKSARHEVIMLASLTTYIPSIYVVLDKHPQILSNPGRLGPVCAYMHAVMGKLCALTAALILALPPGVCCWGGTQPASSAPKHTSCCHKTSQSKEGQLPGCPKGTCCCERNLTSPPDAVQPPDLQAHNVFTAVPSLPLQSGEGTPTPAPLILPTGPPLHALYCVWII